jgi:uncharacterized protein
MQRSILKTLKSWKIQENRKVLLLRGARQVGKTFIVREFAREFKYFAEINFEKNTDLRIFFQQNKDPDRICRDLSVYLGIPVVDHETLLFFDEIQSCPEAIQALRFFYESRAALHVIAAGSLLEFALADLPSWGVGRVRSLYMYPMSFDEFLLASNQEQLLELKQNASFQSPLNKVFHDRLTGYLKEFLLIGGMPETVKTFISNTNNIKLVQRILNDITISYYDDFAKYKKRAPVLRLREVMNAVVRQSGNKFVYSNAGTISNPAQAKEALELLEMAGLVFKVYHSSGQGIPLGAEVNYKKFKAIIHDTGILQQITGLKLSDHMVAENIDMLNKGSIAETFVGLEFLKYSDVYEKMQLNYWHREKRGSNAEVDYLIESEGYIVPVEVKSGSSGKMQSLNIFMDERKSSQGIRISLENFSRYGNINVIPLYAISNLFKKP